MEINLSIVDYIGKLENGVAVILSLIIVEDSFEIIYWFNPEGKYRINFEEKFYEKFKIEDIYDYKYLPDLIHHIDNNVLPNKEEIFKGDS